MCGISGILSLSNRLDINSIIRMTNIIDHRGPDGFGYMGYSTTDNSFEIFETKNSHESSYNLLFGHRRLSIIDLSKSGSQPMSYADNRYCITYNGEIYNYLEIKKRLQGLGYLFRSQTDTEVILAAYEEWGRDCLKYFNGMFAFALLDKTSKKLFCARDRLGIKPFYYSNVKDKLVFASEIKQISCSGIIRFEQNYATIADYFFYGRYNSVGTETFFNDIFELEPGHFFEIDLSEQKIEIKQNQYWSINTAFKVPHAEESVYAEQYYELFMDSVRLRMRSDVPLGSALSGGLDSSGIVCAVNNIMRESGANNKQLTFTAISDVNSYDESHYANSVIDFTGATPHFVLPSADSLLNDYRDLIYHHDEPFISTSIYAGWCVSRLVAQKGVKVSLDGQGPDEMMGGYHPYGPVLLQSLMKMDLRYLKSNWEFYKKSRGLSDKDIVNKMLTLAKPSIINLDFVRSNYKMRASLFNKEDWETKISPSKNPKEVRSLLNSFDAHSLEQTTKFPLPGILKQVDRNSMAFSVESRVPFLDHRLVEFTFSLPLKSKVNNVSKLVYRNAMKNTLPQEILSRKTKLGFVTAEPNWLRRADVRELFLDTYNSMSANSVINKDVIIDKFLKFQKGEIPFERLFWKVFNYEIWLQEFTNRQVDERR